MNKELEEVALQFRKLPGIGVKSARRLAYFMLERPQDEVNVFLDTIRNARSKVCYCSACCNLSTSDPCESAATNGETIPSSAWWNSPRM